MSQEGMSVWATTQPDDSSTDGKRTRTHMPNRDAQMDSLVSDQNSLFIHRLKQRCNLADHFPRITNHTARVEDHADAPLDPGETAIDRRKIKLKGVKKLNDKLMGKATVLNEHEGIESLVTGISNNDIKVPNNYYTLKMADQMKMKRKLLEHLQTLSYE